MFYVATPQSFRFHSTNIAEQPLNTPCKDCDNKLPLEYRGASATSSAARLGDRV